MDVFHSYLKAIEAPGFRYLNFRAKLFRQIFHDDSIRSSKEGQHIFDKMFFFFIELLPILKILIEVNLVGSPKGGEMFFVHLEDGVILYGEEYKPL